MPVKARFLRTAELPMAPGQRRGRATVAVRAAAIAAAVGVSWYGAPAPAGATPYQVATEVLVVQLSGQAQVSPEGVLSGLPGRLGPSLPGNRWEVDVPTGEAAYLQTQLAAEPGVNYVAADQPVLAANAVVPDNPCYGATCGPGQPVTVENPGAGPGATIVHPNGETDLWAVNAPQAWAVTKGNPSVLVAVLDTGVSTSNPQLKGKVIFGPVVCADDDPSCTSGTDNNGHGTFVAGLIAATNDDGIGMASLGWDVKVLSIRILGDDGRGTAIDEATGIYDAVNLGARVINLSTSDSPCSVSPTSCGPNPDIAAAVAYALSHGVVVVAAAGDWDQDQPVYPASYPGVLSVAGATDQGSVDPLSGGPYLDFSDYGEHANIAAPGVALLSTWYDGNYAVESGTPYATALVSAAAALVLSVNPSLTAPEVATLLRSTASPLASGSSSINGGFMNVGAAVQDAAEGNLPIAVNGYDLVASNGEVVNAGAALPEGPLPGKHFGHPIVGVAARPDGTGYWLVGRDGGVFSFGDARFYGSTGHLRLKKPIVAIVPTPDGGGYWLVASDGGLFAFGDAHFYGSTGKLKLSRPIVGMAVTPDGLGYWLVARDGGVFTFGDARFWGSTAAKHPPVTIVGMAATADGAGYWLVGRDGSIYDFGDAPFYGSEAGTPLAQPIVGIAASPYGTGYWILSAGGQVYSIGAATYEPTGPTQSPGASFVGIAS